MSEHQLNRRSSRSHAVYSYYITRTPVGIHAGNECTEGIIENESLDVLQSKLNLVDLAGSERIKKTGSSGELAKEAAHINKSLSYLEQVVLALTKQHQSENGGQYPKDGAGIVAYRQSKLTYLLKVHIYCT